LPTEPGQQSNRIEATEPSASNRRQLATVGFALGLFTLLRMLPEPAGMPPAAWAVAALAILMAVLWFTEALPLAATAMLPFLLLPLMAISTPEKVASTYWSPTIFLVLGGAMFALAVERAGLHIRIALAITRAAPPNPRGLLIGFMVATALVSMVVSNTATTLIMMPVALVLVASSDVALGPRDADRFAIALVLAIAYAANIGGLGTLVGSPTNAIAADIIYRTLDLKVDFLMWAMFGLPIVALAIPASAALLILTCRVPRTGLDRTTIAAALGTSGPLSVDERRLLPLLGLLLVGYIVLPLIKKPLGLPPIEDGMVAIAVALLLLLVPSEKGNTLLSWPDTKRLPWDILLLFGGGLALAAAISDSGLATWLGVQKSALGDLPLWLLAGILVIIIIIVTEFASNVATASGFMPVIAAVVLATGADPLLLAIPAAMASSWGFMMPAGTGPNAIAFGTGRIPIRTMIKTGFAMNLIGVPLIVGVCFAVAAML